MGILIAYVLGILTALKPKYQDGNSDHTSSDSHKQQDPVNRPITVICIPPAKSIEEEAENKKDKRRRTIKFRVEMGSAVVLFIYAALTGIMAFYSIQSVRATRKIIKQTSEIAQRDQRPYAWPTIGPAKIAIKRELVADLFFVNYGKTPALKCKTKSKIVLTPSFYRIDKSATIWKDIEQFFATVDGELDKSPNEGEVIIPQHVPEDTSQSEIQGSAESGIAPSDQQAVDLLLNTDYSYAIVGKMRYFDSFGKMYTTEFCLTHRKDYPKGVWCDKHNEIK
jgi:hypothetical protein